VLKPDVLSVGPDADRERVRSPDPPKFSRDLTVVQVGMVTALAADELICIGVAAFGLTLTVRTAFCRPGR